MQLKNMKPVLNHTILFSVNAFSLLILFTKCKRYSLCDTKQVGTDMGTWCQHS